MGCGKKRVEGGGRRAEGGGQRDGGGRRAEGGGRREEREERVERVERVVEEAARVERAEGREGGGWRVEGAGLAAAYCLTKCTVVPSHSALPSLIWLKWQKRSSPPSFGEMKPKPFSLFHRLAVPSVIPSGGGPVTPPPPPPPRPPPPPPPPPPHSSSGEPPVTSSARSLPLRSSYFLTNVTAAPSCERQVRAMSRQVT